ncbi:hypothetical protein DNHGIG_36310 [Collibacillus ludicampi]|uniref:DUF4168 domain-containing protein n=1 Tax=Collibacillus ludicampi TaxID=2771369 RepID=A0AAV4LJR3_9BACL|nr:hypothetical protein [Collibacillus ludicampi]GIM48082.1 hypothetical protein DNHGIG_36310 [Collibacillus ludicampi]
MKRLIISLFLLASVGYGVWSGVEGVYKKVAEQVLDTVEVTKIQKKISEISNQTEGSKPLQALRSSTSDSSGSTTSGEQGTASFSNREEAIQFAMKRLGPTEFAKLSVAYANRDNLTPEEKNRLKQEVLSHFTPDELRAMQQAANK